MVKPSRDTSLAEALSSVNIISSASASAEVFPVKERVAPGSSSSPDTAFLLISTSASFLLYTVTMPAKFSASTVSPLAVKFSNTCPLLYGMDIGSALRYPSGADFSVITTT